MKFRHRVLRILTVVVLVCVVLPAPAEAQFSQQGPKLVGSGAVGPLGFQGFSVSLSSDGNTAIVGGPGDNCVLSGGCIGAAWVFIRSGGVWSQQGPKLVGSDAVGLNVAQGVSVSASADGNTAIVGSAEDNMSFGAAWVFTRSGGVWSQQGPKLVGTGAVGPEPSIGNAVSLSGDGNTAILGGPVDSDGVGAAWVFTRLGGMWTQEAKLIGSGVLGNAFQGSSVSLSGDGKIAIVGGPEDDNNVGAAWVFTRFGEVWTQQAKLVGTGAIGTAHQGNTVSLSADGSTAVVGGWIDNDEVGAAWVFTRSGGVWSQQAKLVGTGSVGNALQGTSVSLSGDGNTAIVGGTNDNDEVGAAWVFTHSGGGWSQLGSKLVGSDSVGQALEGNSVSLSGDASTAIVGGYVDNGFVGAAWVYTRPVFAGTPGRANCHGQSVSALARQYGGLSGAAAALGFSSVQALQSAILTFCEG